MHISFFLVVHLLYTYIVIANKGAGKMHQKRKKYDTRDRLIQYAIEIFDLVDLDADADPGEPIRRRFTHSSAPRVRSRGRTEPSVSYMAGSP